MPECRRCLEFHERLVNGLCFVCENCIPPDKSMRPPPPPSPPPMVFDCKVWQCEKCGRTQTTKGADYLAGKCRDCDLQPIQTHVREVEGVVKGTDYSKERWQEGAAVFVGHEYLVHKCEHGIAITGGVPVSELANIARQFGMEGKEAIASMRLARAMNVALVFCKNKEDEQAWWDMILFMNDLKDTPYPAPGNAGA